MKKFLMLGAITLLAFSFSIAQNRVPPGQRGGANGVQLLRQLKLTDQQRKDIQDLRFDLQKKMIEQQAKVKTARLELAELFKADTPDKAAIENKAAEVSQLQSQQRILALDHWFAVNKLLTPDQQKVWKRALGHFVAQRRVRMVRNRVTQFMRGRRNQFRMQQTPAPAGR
jgi:Spy/CpxP family protein refolding chaperone